ncbi:MAG: chemotaxis protein CheW [Vulcanimicrobiota bacterium]
MSASVKDSTKQFLTFRLGEELFAVEIDKVREVMDYTTITRVPRVPEFMMGVINLRGNVVPVIDMRLKFGMTKTERTVNTCIIIVEVEHEEESLILGALADSVQEVFEIEQGQIEPPPKIGTRLRTEFIQGMGKRDSEEQFVIILDIDKIFSTDELEIVGEMDRIAPNMDEEPEKETVKT